MTFPNPGHSESLPTPSFPILLSPTAEQNAHAVSQHCPFHRKEPVYLRAIARFAVNHYLQCLGIDTALNGTEFTESFRRILMDVADIILPDLGRIECCPVLPGEEQVRIPAEVWEERLAYFAVEVDLEKRQAIILGFLNHLNPRMMEEQNSEMLPLQNFRGMDELPDFLMTAKPLVIELKQWWSNFFSQGWNSLDGLLQPNSLTLSGAYRSQGQADLRQKMQEFFGSFHTAHAYRTSPDTHIAGYKLVSFNSASSHGMNPASIEIVTEPTTETATSSPLESDTQNHQVALVLHVSREHDNEFDLSLDAIPGATQEFLPDNLRLALLDDQGVEILVACTQHHNRHLQLEFSGALGDDVVVKLSLNELNFEEKILIE